MHGKDTIHMYWIVVTCKPLKARYALFVCFEYVYHNHLLIIMYVHVTLITYLLTYLLQKYCNTNRLDPY